MAAIVGTGTTITFNDQTNFQPEVTSLTGNGKSRAVLNTAHLGTTGAHTKIVGQLVDEGDLSIEFWLDGDATQGFPTLGTSPATNAVLIEFPDGSGLQGPALITNFSWSAPLEELTTGSCTITWTDDVTYSSNIVP